MKSTDVYYSLDNKEKREAIRKLYNIELDDESLELIIELRDLPFTYLENVMKLADRHVKGFGLAYDEDDFEKIARRFDTFSAHDLENYDLNTIKLNELFELLEREEILKNLCSLFLQKMNEKYHDKLSKDEKLQKNKQYTEAHGKIGDFVSMLDGNIESTKTKINSVIERIR